MLIILLVILPTYKEGNFKKSLDIQFYHYFLNFPIVPKTMFWTVL